jgi:hypothetical protein
MELARSWFTSPSPCVPSEVASLFDSSPMTAGMAVEYVRPECVTAFPERGEGRNHDLVMVGKSKRAQVTVCVEAKADEPFGEIIGDYLRQTVQKAKAEHRRTGLPDRVEALLGLVFGAAADSALDPWRALRYQLLTGVAGTLIQAAEDGADIGVFLVHEFVTESVDRRKARKNAGDFSRFVAALFGKQSAATSDGALIGPISYSAGPHLKRPVSLLVGKVVFDWSAKASAQLLANKALNATVGRGRPPAR